MYQPVNKNEVEELEPEEKIRKPIDIHTKVRYIPTGETGVVVGYNRTDRFNRPINNGFWQVNMRDWKETHKFYTWALHENNLEVID